MRACVCARARVCDIVLELGLGLELGDGLASVGFGLYLNTLVGLLVHPTAVESPSRPIDVRVDVGDLILRDERQADRNR